MNDSISRQAAIDAISCDITITGRQNALVATETIEKFLDRIKALPPAKPEIIRCRECVRYQTQDCFMHIERLWELTPDDYCSQGERKSG